jgi:hypothetical protein
MSGPYDGYKVLSKWNTPSFDAPTREVLARRLAPPPEPRFFRYEVWWLVEAIAARILPQPERAEPIPLAALIDDYFAEGRGQGYREETMPPLHAAWRIGLAAIDAEARRRFERGFAALAAEAQDETLRAVQAGDVEPAVWQGMDPKTFFRESLLKIIAGLYYAHPTAWSEIGFGGPASPRGYVRLGFDERDPWEAKERP